MYGEWIGPYKNFIKWIDNNYKKLNFNFNNIFSNNFYIDINKKNEVIFKNFLQHYKETCMTFYYLNFSWGLSSGEYNFLSLYSRLFSALELEANGTRVGNIINNLSTEKVICNNILLMIDESDLSYHPKWQSKFIKCLINFLEYEFKGCNIQVILTTHSPIILSDIPNSNVVYLKDGKNIYEKSHNKTFAQNIYTLFNDGFFLETPIGKFAKHKIEYISQVLNSKGPKIDDKSINNIKKIIGFIGEPVKKYALENKLLKLEESYESDDLKHVMKKFDKLSSDDKTKLIKHIIDIKNQYKS